MRERSLHVGQWLAYYMLKCNISPRRDATFQKMCYLNVGKTAFENKRFA